MPNTLEVLFAMRGEARRTTRRLAASIGSYATSVVSDTMELLAPAQTPDEFVASLQRDRPYSEVEVANGALKAAERLKGEAFKLAGTGDWIGVTAEERSRRKLDEAEVMQNIGYGILKRSVLRADESDVVPDVVTQELVFTALEYGADPQRKGFMTQEDMQVVQEVFNKHDNTIAFPGGK